MKNILKDNNSAARLLKITCDNLILVDKDGICVDVLINEHANQWVVNEEKLLGKNIWEFTPEQTLQQIYPFFQSVLQRKVRIAKEVEMKLYDKTYFFNCVMTPYDDMVLFQYRDITERSQQKITLERQNRAFGEIQKAALIGNWHYDSETDLFSYQGHTGIMASQKEQSITLNDYLKIIIAEDRSTFNNWLSQTMKGNLAGNLDYRIRFNNKIYYIRLKCFARERQKDGHIKLEGYIQNITDLQQSRNDISLLTNVINNSAEDIFAATEDGTLIFANRRFREHHNIDLKCDVTQLCIYELNSFVNDKESWEQFISKVDKEVDDTPFILQNPMPLYPEILALEGHAYWSVSDDGKDTLWSFSRDITQRILREQENKRYNEILDKVIENLPAGIVVKDIKNNFAYMYRNRESYKLESNMINPIGKNDYDFYPIEVADEKRKQDLEVSQTGKTFHQIIEEKDNNGNTIYIDKRKILIESKDFSSILLNIDWDITETEQMKRELIVAKEKAETSDKLKSAFLANMSHEIRTPLNAIVGFSRIIAESEDIHERESYYNIIEANNERLLQLINEILDLSKIEAGIVEFSLGEVNLHELSQEIHNAHRLRCPENVELIFETSDPEILVEGDKNRIFQVVSNLIGNAFKFTKTGSISYGYQIKNGMAEFHVTDTGTGIAPDKIDKIFERFVKANSFVQGTGLGLSISKTIIEKMGGNIWVESELEKGTTFYFTLPLIKLDIQIDESENLQSSANVKDATASRNNNNNHDVKTILVAEDTDSNYILVKAILGKLYHLVRAHDGMEAVTKFEECKPDLILMDMKMPNLNGLDATRIIRELSPNIPIIALTAFAFEHDKQAALEAGCNDFLTKPFTQEIIKKTLNKYLNPQ